MSKLYRNRSYLKEKRSKVINLYQKSQNKLTFLISIDNCNLLMDNFDLLIDSFNLLIDFDWSLNQNYIELINFNWKEIKITSNWSTLIERDQNYIKIAIVDLELDSYCYRHPNLLESKFKSSTIRFVFTNGPSLQTTNGNKI